MPQKHILRVASLRITTGTTTLTKARLPSKKMAHEPACAFMFQGRDDPARLSMADLCCTTGSRRSTSDRSSSDVARASRQPGVARFARRAAVAGVSWVKDLVEPCRSIGGGRCAVEADHRVKHDNRRLTGAGRG